MIPGSSGSRSARRADEQGSAVSGVCACATGKNFLQVEVAVQDRLFLMAPTPPGSPTFWTPSASSATSLSPAAGLAATVTISAAVEGSLDEAVVSRFIRNVGALPGTVYGKNGKPYLRGRIYVEHQREALFYLRVGNGTRALPVDEVVRYVHSHCGTTA